MQDPSQGQHKNNSPYQQSIEMGAHVQVPKPSGPGYAVLNDEEQQSDSQAGKNTDIIQQGIVYQSMPVGTHYPNAQFPPGYNTAAFQGVHPQQLPLSTPQHQIFIVETKIKTEFCCYTCLVYFGLIGCALGLLGSLSGIGESGFSLLQFIFLVLFLVGYIMAIKAKMDFDAKMQHRSFVIFCIMTVVHLITGLIAFPMILEEYRVILSQDDLGESQKQIEQAMRSIRIMLIFFMVLLPLSLNLLLVYNANAIGKLMKERQRLLNAMTSVSIVA